MKSELMGATAIVAVFASLEASAIAQEQDTSSRFNMEEVIVTAQRREQSILDVPVSATVFSADLIEKANFREAKDYLVLTPNVSFRTSGRNGAREIVISIRGISDVKGGEKVTTQSAFSTYFDEFSVGTLAGGQANPPIYDVEGVEILRGPQGVFFGRNSEGGAINIRSKKPGPEHYGQVDAGFGRFNTFELGGVVNVPVTDTLYTRLTVQGTKTDGPLKNAHPTGGDTGNHYLAMRGQLRWQPTTNTTVDLSVNYILDNQDYTPKLATCLNPTFGFNPFDPNVLGGIGCYDPGDGIAKQVADGNITLPPGVSLSDVTNNRKFIYQNTPEFTNYETAVYIGRIEHNFGDAVSLVSVTGYAQSDMDQYIDLDKSGLDSIDRLGKFNTDSWSQEVRLSSIGNERFQWTLGGIYYEERFHAQNQILIKDFVGPWLRGDRANENIIDIDRSGWAVFGNIEYNLTDNVSLIVGGRYAEDDDEQVWSEVYAACARRALGDPLAPGCSLRPDQLLVLPVQINGNGDIFVSGGRTAQTIGTSAKNSGSDFSPRLAINWRPYEDVSVYASVSKGYKPAGARANPDSGLNNISLFDKERLWNYEIGANARLMDGRIVMQGAIFWMDWRDYQVDVRQSFCRVGSDLIPLDEFTGTDCLITPVDRTDNANKARSRGIEFAMQGLVTNRLKAGFTLGYLDAKFIDFVTNLRGSTQDVSGERIGQAPKWTASAHAEYFFPITGHAEGFLRGEWSYRSEGALDIVQRASNTFPTRVPSYHIFNLRTGINWENHNLSLSVNNILNKDYYTGADGFSYGGATLDFNPRTWFVRWTTKL